MAWLRAIPAVLLLGLLWLLPAHASDFSALTSELGRNPAAALVEIENLKRQPERSAAERAELHLLAGEAQQLLTRGREALLEAEAGLALLPASTEQDPLPLAPIPVRLQLLRAGALDLLGQSGQALGGLNQLVERLQQASTVAPQLLVEALLTRATLALTLRDAPAALADLQRAYQLAAETDPRVARGDVAGTIANLYAQQDDPENALRYYREAISYFQRTGADIKLSISVYGIGTMYRDLRNWPEARRYFGWSLELSRKQDDWQGVAYAQQQLAHVAVETGQLDEAQGLLDAAQPLFEQAEDHAMLVNTTISRADLLGVRKRFDDAMRVLQQAEAMAERHQLAYAKQMIWLRRADLHAIQKKYAEAYDAFRVYHQQHEDAFRTESGRQLQELRVKFDSERQEQQNILLKQENALQEAALKEQQHRLWLYVAVALLSLLSTFFLLYVIYKGRQVRQKLDALAHTDELTGLPNRRHLMQEALLEVERAKRYDLPLCLAVLDLDHFKHINDQFGHAAGDEVLRQFAELCQRMLRQTDLIGRIGGEEFALLLPHTSQLVAVQILERLRCDFRQLAWPQLAGKHQPTVSIGLTALTVNDSNLAELLRRADEALYAAKAAGRDQVVCKERVGASATGDRITPVGTEYEKY